MDREDEITEGMSYFVVSKGGAFWIVHLNLLDYRANKVIHLLQRRCGMEWPEELDTLTSR